MIGPMAYVQVYGTNVPCSYLSCEEVSSPIYIHCDSCPAHQKCHEKAMHYLDGNFHCGFCLERVNPKTLLTERQIEQIKAPAASPIIIPAPFEESAGSLMSVVPKVDTPEGDGFLMMEGGGSDAAVARKLWETEIGYGSPNDRDDW